MQRNDEYIVASNTLLSYSKTMWSGYLAPKHVIELCAHLEMIEDGTIDRLIVSMPPRHSKSLNIAENFPAWYLGRNPDKQVIYASYSANQAKKYGRKIRNQLIDPKFNLIFPKCEVSKDTKSKDNIELVNGGVYYALGRGGSVTGKGADLFLLDDMIKDQREALSPKIRGDLQDWYRSVADTRLQSNSAVVICGTRWHEDDLIGWAIKELADQNWVVLNYPAMNDDETETLWPEKFPLEWMKKKKKTQGTYFWNALYMGRPSALEGNIFKKNDWRFWREKPREGIFIQSWDTKAKNINTGAYCVGQIWCYLAPNFYLIDQFRKRVGFTETKKKIMMYKLEYPKAFDVVIENKANGPSIFEDLQDKISGVKEFSPEQYGSKEDRACAVSSMQESGNIILPDPTMPGYEWVKDYIETCAAFPNCDFKDEIDAMTQAILYLKGSNKEVERLKRLLSGF